MGVPSSSGTAVQVLVYVWLVLLVRDATAAGKRWYEIQTDAPLQPM
jgi:hypothetical protein